jgi:hypothetical protein
MDQNGNLNFKQREGVLKKLVDGRSSLNLFPVAQLDKMSCLNWDKDSYIRKAGKAFFKNLRTIQIPSILILQLQV